MDCAVCGDGRGASFADDLFEDSFECRGCGRIYGREARKLRSIADQAFKYKMLSRNARLGVLRADRKKRERGF